MQATNIESIELKQHEKNPVKAYGMDEWKKHEENLSNTKDVNK